MGLAEKLPQDQRLRMVGQRVAKLRKQRNLRVDDVAARLGVAAAEITTLEHSGSGRLELLSELASLFEVDPVAFFMESEIFSALLSQVAGKLAGGEKASMYLGLAFKDVLGEICKELSGDKHFGDKD